MKYWKITNTCNQPVKVAVSTSSSTSKAIKLEPNQFTVCCPKQTPSMDAQIRRKFIIAEANFENDLYGFEMGIAYNQSELDAKKLAIAEVNAEQYKNNTSE